MADLIVFSTTDGNRRIRERSAYVITARFRNRATAADVTPTNVYWRLDCLTTGRVLANWASASPGTTVALTTTATHNTILDGCNPRERRQLTVSADRDLSTEYTETFDYEVENVQGIT